MGSRSDATRVRRPGPRGCSGRTPGPALAGDVVVDQLAMALRAEATHMPAVATVVRLDVRLVDQRDAVLEPSALEPAGRVGDAHLDRRAHAVAARRRSSSRGGDATR